MLGVAMLPVVGLTPFIGNELVLEDSGCSPGIGEVEFFGCDDNYEYQLINSYDNY